MTRPLTPRFRPSLFLPFPRRGPSPGYPSHFLPLVSTRSYFFSSLSLALRELPAVEFASTILHRNNSTLRSATTAYVTRNNSRTCDPIHRTARNDGIRNRLFRFIYIEHSEGGLQRFLVSISRRCTPLVRSICHHRYTFQAGHPDPRPIGSSVPSSNRNRAFHLPRTITKLYRPNIVPNRSGSETRASACFVDSKQTALSSLFALTKSNSSLPFSMASNCTADNG